MFIAHQDEERSMKDFGLLGQIYETTKNPYIIGGMLGHMKA
jgi:hypothetical protein